MKKLDYFLNTILVILAIVLCIYSWIWASKITQHKFEPLESDVLIPYQFTQEDDGMVIQSEYGLAWKHSTFSDSRIVAYDSIYGNSVYLKKEYEEEYHTTMPEGKYYNWYYHCFWIYLILFVVISIVSVYYIGRRVRDYILYIVLSLNPSFKKCAYFLYGGRTCCKKNVQELLPRAVANFIQKEKNNLYKRYKPNFVELIISLLNTIKQQSSTNVKFNYSYNVKTINHETYLSNLINYWQSQIGKDSVAEGNVKYLEDLQSKKYVKLSYGGDSTEFENSVSCQLKKLFTEVLGTEIFDFVPARGEEGKSGIVYVTTSIENSSHYFTWSGVSQAGNNFPGIAVRFMVYHYIGGKQEILWDKYLDPVCKYSCPDSEFSVYVLYTNMVRQTIETFTSSLKKS